MELISEVGTPTTTAVPSDALSNAAIRRSTRRRYLMCPPAHFDVVYSINPWMNPAKPTDQPIAAAQWQRIHDQLVDLGHAVDVIPPVPGLPDMVFAANGATVWGDRALVARFRHTERDAESAAYLDWFAERGLHVQQASTANEGEGDYLSAGPWLLAGSGFRTDRRAHLESEQYFDRPVIGLTLVDDRYYHLDTALAVLDDETVMYYPGAFTSGSQAILRELFPSAIIATAKDAGVFALNAVSDGLHVLMPAGSTDLVAKLREAGFVPIGMDVSELLRAGGGVKCCVLELHGPAGRR
ncbi:dimethylargininase [Kribbella speibonae]|uniref:Amidinotransferase n=1 Tax=Kribbella speibonae TaxID=1572660 RepID=A0ABY2A6H7_9ACTN|nr:dimethylargininase [Kribbella speibonae]TCC24692.1 amidinotransferase [Kribbella speibonae]